MCNIMNMYGHSEDIKHSRDCQSELVAKIKEEQEPLLETKSHEEDLSNLNASTLTNLEEKHHLDTMLELKANVPNSQSSVMLSTEHVTHPGIRLYKCSQCSECFLSSDDCETHQQSHKCKNHSFQEIQSKKYCCTHCLKTFAMLSHFIVHQQIHRGEGGAERPFDCSRCGKRFYRESGLKAHEQNHMREKLHRCAQCGKLFSKKSVLTKHQQTHTTEELYRCSTCSQSFSSSHLYEKHMGESHAGQRVFCCSHCRSFPTEHSLKKHNHKKSYTVVKPAKRKLYCCSHCSKTFSSLSLFFVHQQIHRGNGKGGRPFSCTRCGKTFYRETGLKMHEQRHTDEEASSCSSCGESFASKCLLMRNPFKCSKCDSHFLELRPPACHYGEKMFSADFTHQQHLQTQTDTSMDRFCAQKQSSAGNACSASPKNVKRMNKDLVVDHKTERLNFFKSSAQFSPFLKPTECHQLEKQSDTQKKAVEGGAGPSVEKPCIVLQNFTSPLTDRRETSMKLTTENLAENAGKPKNLEMSSLSKESQVALQDLDVNDSFGEDCHEKVITEEVKEEQVDHRDSESLGVNEHASDAKDTSSVGTQRTENLKKLQFHSAGIHQPSAYGKSFFSKNGCGTQQQRLSTGFCSQEVIEGMKTYCCLDCGKRFNSSTHYIVHLQIHRKDGKEERPFSCSYCGKRFYRVPGLKKHQQSGVCQGVPCSSQCGKSPSKKTLLTDRLCLAEEKVQRCSKCHQDGGTSISRGCGVKSHKQIESRENSSSGAGHKSYSCSHCGKSFSVLMDHIVHQQIHREGRGGRSFSCSLCGKSFYREGGLRKHQQTHGAQGHTLSAMHDGHLSRARFPTPCPAGDGQPSTSCQGDTMKTDSVLVEQT